MSENVSSSVLFHFTKTMNDLKSILNYGFFPHYCPEFTLDPIDRKAAAKGRPPDHAIPLVSFCDLPFSLIKKHLREYGYFGIGLEKKWGVRNGVAPVIYTHRTAQTCQPILRLTAIAAENNSEIAANDFKVLAAYAKPFVGPAWRNNRVERGVRFYDEREWRYVPEPGFLDWKDYIDESKRIKLHKRFKKQYALLTPPKDIQYLFVPYDKDENNILELHAYVMKLFGRRYSRKDAILVTTAIMTVDRIEKDS
jgi:hypothetical protein